MSRLNDIKKVIEAAPKVPLGELIEPISNQVNKAGYNYPFMGVNINKQIVPTVANVSTVDSKKYIYIKNNQFVFSGMQTGRDECVRFSLYTGDTPVLLSPAYTILQVKDSVKVLPEFIFAQFLSSEKDRLGWFYSDSSVRANLDLPRFLDIRIPLPPLDVQKEYVDAYDGLQQLILQNEAILKPLSDACQAYLAEVKSKYDEVTLGDYIEPVDIRNIDRIYNVNNLQGVTSDGQFDLSKAKTDGIDFSKYKIVKELNFAYNPSRINLGSIALRKGGDCIVSPMYVVFGVKDDALHSLMHDYLFLWFMRAEFQRSTLFYASGSVRDTFSFEEMCRVRIPLPPLDVQKSIVALHKCAEEARSIATEARETLRRICPAMVQRAAHHIK
mgnify:CR=1 FL=1